MTDIVELQRKRIKQLEEKNGRLLQELLTLKDSLHKMSHVLCYLTDEEFRKFTFKLNYDRLITEYLENESNGEEWI